MPSTSATIAASSSAAGTRRRHRDRSGIAAFTSARLAKVTAYLRRRRRIHHAPASTASGSSSAKSAKRPEEAHGQITRPYQRIERPAASRISTSAPPAKIAVISVLRPTVVSFRSMRS